MAQRIAVIGTGYVGLIQAVGFADFGNYVVGVDVGSQIVDKLGRGVPTIFEHGLTDAVENAELVFIAVGTPENDDGTADLSRIRSVVEGITRHANGFTVVVTKSTVPVGTNRWIAKELVDVSGDQPEFVVAGNPEFLREGRAVRRGHEPHQGGNFA